MEDIGPNLKIVISINLLEMNNSLNSSKIEHYHNPYEIATQQNMEVQFNEDDEFAAIEERINQLNGIEVF